MKLPISLLLLLAVSQAVTLSTASTKTSPAKTAGLGHKVAVQKTNQTSKRELLEGNFGERIAKFGGISLQAPRIEYAENIKSDPGDQSPAQMYRGHSRLPHIAKISDVLTGHGPPFEVAVANHLYSPVSVYQARHSSPTDFEIPAPAASLAYSNPIPHQPNNFIAENQEPQTVPINVADAPEEPTKNIEVPALKQHRFHFSHLLPLRPGLPQNIFPQPRDFTKSQPSYGQLVPLYDHQNGQAEQGPPSHVYYQKGLYQLVPIPIGQNLEYVNQEEPHKYQPEYPKFEDHQTESQNPKQEKAETAPEAKPGYHAHPNGAVSYVSYSHVPVRLNHESPDIVREMNKIIYDFPSRLPNSQQNVAVMKQKYKITVPPQENVQQSSNIEPEIKQEPQYRPKLQPINHSENLKPQHLHHKTSRIPYPAMYFQRLPSFKPQDSFQSNPSSKSTTSLPFIQESRSKPRVQPRPFGFSKQWAAGTTSLADHQMPPVLQHSHLTPLPPLKPNYNPTVRPLSSQTRTTPAFLPTVRSLSTTTTTSGYFPDQVISSTTVRPTRKDEQIPEQATNAETQPQSQIAQSLQPEIVYQSQPTEPVPIPSSTQEPDHQSDSQSESTQNSTPQPQNQSTVTPSAPRHEVIIQKQELQELIFEPSSEPSIGSQYYQQQHQQEQNDHHQQDIESLQLISQQQQHELEQLQLQQYNNELQRLQTSQVEQTEQNDDQQYSQSPQNHYQPEHTQQQAENQPSEHTQPAEPNTQETEKEQNTSEQNHPNTSTVTPSTQDHQKGQFVYSHQAIPVPVPHYFLKLHSGDLHNAAKFVSLQEPGLSTPKIPESGEFLGPILTPIQPLPADFYAHPQELVVNSEFAAAPAHSEVQYFGKFAHELFGKHG